MVVVGGYLGLTTLRDKTVDEAIAAGTAELAGSFESRAHTTTGTARVIEQADGSRVLALVDFRTDAGPDLFVYVVPRAAAGNDVDGGTRLGALKGNVGNQQSPYRRISSSPTRRLWWSGAEPSRSRSARLRYAGRSEVMDLAGQLYNPSNQLRELLAMVDHF